MSVCVRGRWVGREKRHAQTGSDKGKEGEGQTHRRREKERWRERGREGEGEVRR